MRRRRRVVSVFCLMTAFPALRICFDDPFEGAELSHAPTLFVAGVLGRDIAASVFEAVMKQLDQSAAQGSGQVHGKKGLRLPAAIGNPIVFEGALSSGLE